jgi:hypothetical protein
LLQLPKRLRPYRFSKFLLSLRSSDTLPAFPQIIRHTPCFPSDHQTHSLISLRSSDTLPAFPHITLPAFPQIIRHTPCFPSDHHTPCFRSDQTHSLERYLYTIKCTVLHAQAMKSHGGVKVELHSFLNLALGAREVNVALQLLYPTDRIMEPMEQVAGRAPETILTFARDKTSLTTSDAIYSPNTQSSTVTVKHANHSRNLSRSLLFETANYYKQD